MICLILLSGLVVSQSNSESYASGDVFSIPSVNTKAGSGWSSNDRNKHSSDINSAIGSANRYTDSKLNDLQKTIDNSTNIAYKEYSYVSSHNHSGKDDWCGKIGVFTVMCPAGKRPDVIITKECRCGPHYSLRSYNCI